jgi:hypothetical protein
MILVDYPNRSSPKDSGDEAYFFLGRRYLFHFESQQQRGSLLVQLLCGPESSDKNCSYW